MTPSLLAVLLLATPQSGARIEVHAIEVSAIVRDAEGKVPRDLKPDDFVLTEDGKPQRIISVSYVDAVATDAPARQIVIFLQQSLSTTDGLREAMRGLAPNAERLTQAGEVEIVTDSPTPHSLFGPSRDAKALRAALERAGKEIEGHEEIMRSRQGWIMSGRAQEQFRSRVKNEWTILRTRQDSMLEWLGRYPHVAGGVRTLVFVSDGFDVDPSLFYVFDPDPQKSLPQDRALVHDLNEAAHFAEITQSLAAERWTIVPIAMESSARRVTSFKETERKEGVDPHIDASHMENVNRMNAAALMPLFALADATGGAVVIDPSKIGAQLDSIAARVVITYQVDRGRDDEIRRIDVRATRPGLTVRAQKFARSGAEEHGDLLVTCSLKSIAGGSEVSVNVDLTPIEDQIEGVDSGTLRFTITVIPKDGPTFTTTRRLEQLDLAAKKGWSTTFDIRHTPGARISLTASETSTGAWGTCAP
jgi:VWFA-related protein